MIKISSINVVLYTCRRKFKIILVKHKCFFVSQEVYVSVREKKRYCKFSWKSERRKIYIDNNENDGNGRIYANISIIKNKVLVEGTLVLTQITFRRNILQT